MAALVGLIALSGVLMSGTATLRTRPAARLYTQKGFHSTATTSVIIEATLRNVRVLDAILTRRSSASCGEVASWVRRVAPTPRQPDEARQKFPQ